ncbi:tetratricopeptide repeat-containing glycosyltransferase family 2 protein [Lentibacillus sp. Marseille-P4043]|uniref:tetratricopeptide repeat-containing glycosyltransferase family 2 protein n=1 Tax=Lentibacillus sp. Marseille-P4043 TaxID=2040293 RepID=UPI000D0B6F81|nr:glycosyltransferase [Lentibacillus sp. Marseille-P4043]
MKPFISLCMIVKNEKKVIERCLSSITHLVDEVVVVDTGSTDNTKELVSKYTSKIYDFEWVDDFSIARNYAASKASGEWILVLDADEYVDEENFKQFIHEIKINNNQYDSYYAKILNFAGNFGETLIQNFHDRIYKNNGKIKYYRKIHEQFKNKTGEPLKSKNSSLLIFHSGYLKNIVTEKQKNNRNKELIDMEMNSGSKNAFDYFNLGNEYSSIREYEKALDSYLEAYKNKSDFRLAWVSTTLIQIILCLVNLKRYNDALNVIEDAANIYTNSPEFPYLKGEVFFQRGQLEDAKEIFQEIVNHQEDYDHIIFRPDLKDQRPHLRLGEIFLLQEDYNGAIYHYVSVLNINKYNEEIIKKIIYILNKFHSDEEIANFLFSNELIASQNIKSYVKVCFDIGDPKLALRLLSEYHEDNKILYQVALLKNLCVNGEGTIEDLDEISDGQILKNLLEANWIHIIDLLLLREHLNQEGSLAVILKPFEQFKQYKALIDLVDGYTSIDTFDEELILFSLQALLSYKNIPLCNVILEDIETVDQKTIAKVARVLYLYGLKVEALQLYDNCDWNSFENQDFINVINSLLETKNKDDAIQVAKFATLIYKHDFRFYRYILDHTKDNNLFSYTIKQANKLFTNSVYLEKINCVSK